MADAILSSRGSVYHKPNPDYNIHSGFTVCGTQVSPRYALSARVYPSELLVHEEREYRPCDQCWGLRFQGKAS